LHKLKTHIPTAYDQLKPDLVIYNAGTDCMDGDPLGGLHISAQGIIDRDALMFEYAINEGVPIVMVLSGGY